MNRRKNTEVAYREATHPYLGRYVPLPNELKPRGS